MSAPRTSAPEETHNGAGRSGEHGQGGDAAMATGSGPLRDTVLTAVYRAAGVPATIAAVSEPLSCMLRDAARDFPDRVALDFMAATSPSACGLEGASSPTADHSWGSCPHHCSIVGRRSAHSGQA